MNPREYSSLVKILNTINYKIDLMERMLTQISNELSSYRGNNIHTDIDSIKQSLCTVTNDIDTGEVKSLKNMMNNLQKSIEYIQNKSYE